MNDKRDEVIEAANRFIKERNRLRYGITDNTQAHITADEMADFAICCVIDRDIEIAKKLVDCCHHKNVRQTGKLVGDLMSLIAELRGNK